MSLRQGLPSVHAGKRETISGRDSDLSPGRFQHSSLSLSLIFDRSVRVGDIDVGGRTCIGVLRCVLGTDFAPNQQQRKSCSLETSHPKASIVCAQIGTSNAGSAIQTNTPPEHCLYPSYDAGDADRVWAIVASTTHQPRLQQNEANEGSDR